MPKKTFEGTMKISTPLTATFSRPTFGPVILTLDAPWKPCSAEWTSAGVFASFCNNDSRRHTRVFLGTKEIHADDGVKYHNETIGPAFEWGGYIGFAGECGHLLYYSGGRLRQGFSLRYANTILDIAGAPYVFDTSDGVIRARNCFTGATILTMPGDGIVLQACHYGGNIYAAVADGEKSSGLSCSDGSMIPAAYYQCVIPFAGRLLYSSANRIFALGHHTPVAVLNCEKIMYMRVRASTLWIAGANPDTLFCANARGEIIQVGCCPDGNKPVGGSCFRVAFAISPWATEGYFLRTVNGNQASVIRIDWRQP